MNKNTLAFDMHKKDETSTTHTAGWRLALQALAFFGGLVVSLAIFFRALFYLWSSLQSNQYVQVLSNHFTVALMLWWQLWLYGRLLKSTGNVLKKSAAVVALTVLSWEFLTIVTLRIMGSQLLARPTGTLGLLLLGITIGTLAMKRVFGYTLWRSLLLALACVAGLFPIYQLIGLLGYLYQS